MDGWGVKIATAAAAAIFCIGLLNAAGVNAQAFALECVIGGQQPSASFNIDATNKTTNTGKGIVPGQVSAKTVTWYASSPVSRPPGGALALGFEIPFGPRATGASSAARETT